MGEIGSGPAAARDGLEARVVELGPALRRIALRGPLPVGWAGRFAAGLALRQIGIVRGWGCERAGGRWEAQLEVALPGAGAELTPATVLDLTAPGAPPPRAGPDALVISSHRIVRAGAELEVSLTAPDARGLLDRVLRVFALYGLFPRELQLETEHGVARDLFRLQSMHGRAPDQAVASALSLRLGRATAPAAPRPSAEG